MPRPKTKKDLLELGKTNFKKLMEKVDSLGDGIHSIEFPEGYLNRNVKDVLAHLHEWHNMMLEWYRVGMSGVKPDMPKKGYTWKTVPELNREIWTTYKEETYETIRKMLENSHLEVRKIIESHSDEDLFTKKKYKWTGSTSLGAYLISATSSHYDWAIKLIKKCVKS